MARQGLHKIYATGLIVPLKKIFGGLLNLGNIIFLKSILESTSKE